jgi:hypothetical protein
MRRRAPELTGRLMPLLARRRTAIPLPAQSALYIDAADAPLGVNTGLTARGSWACVFAKIMGTTGAADNVMEADGLDLNGHGLRWNGSVGPYTKFTIIADVTRGADPLSGAGNYCALNQNGATGVRFWLRYTAANWQIVGPNGVTINMAAIGAYGDRQVVGGELDIAAGTLTAIEADGETQTVAISTSAFPVTRIDIGQNCIGKIHRLAVLAS